VNIKRLLFIGLIALCGMLPAFGLESLPQISGRITDVTGTLDASQVSDLERRLKAFEDSAGSQIAVAIIPTTGEEAIEAYSMRLAEAWKIGRKKIDDGVILLIAKNDRAMRIEVGYGLEGALPDITSKRIISDWITPQFQQGNFYSGISVGIDAIMTAIRGETLPLPQKVSQGQRGQSATNLSLGPLILVGIVAAVIGFLVKLALGRVVGGLVGAGIGIAAGFWLIPLGLAFILAIFLLMLIAAPEMLFMLLASSGRSRGGGGGGGFSGGGGSFGGGGASGRW